MDGSKVSPQDMQNVQTSNYHKQAVDFNKNSTTQNMDNQNHYRRNIICFWMIGIMNGIGVSVLSSSIFDVIKRLEGISGNSSIEANVTHRDCMETSPAIFLLAGIMPALVLKLVLPFLKFYVNANIILASLLSIASFTTVVVANQKWQIIMSIIFMSISGDLGDITLITYLANFIDRKNILVAYSSGSGFSGVIASFGYAALCDIGITPKTILIWTLLAPLMGLVAFLFIKESKSTTSSKGDSINESDSTLKEDPPTTLDEKWRYLPKLTKYFIPMLINCLFVYIIGQTIDLIYVPGIWLDHAGQYRWIGAISEIGSFFGQISLSYLSMDNIWPLNLLTGVFMAYFLFESIYLVSNIWIIFISVFVVAFISDYTILNVYNRLTDETPSHYQVFAVCSVSIGISVGIMFAGGLTIPLHNMICKLPLTL